MNMHLNLAAFYQEQIAVIILSGGQADRMGYVPA